MTYYIKFKEVDVPKVDGEWYLSKFRSENKFYHYEQIDWSRETYFGNSQEEDILYVVRPFLYNESGEEIGPLANEMNWLKPQIQNKELKTNQSYFVRDSLIYLYNE